VTGNDLANHDEVRRGLVAKELEQAIQEAFALQDVHQSSVPGTGEDHGDALNRENEARAKWPEYFFWRKHCRRPRRRGGTQAALVLSSGTPRKSRRLFHSGQGSSFSVGF